MKYKFGVKGIWHSSKEVKGKIIKIDIPVVILDQIKIGDADILNIFELGRKGSNIISRVHTIFYGDFTPNKI